MQPYRSPVFLSRLAIAGLALSGVCRILYLVASISMFFVPSRSFDLGDNDSLFLWELVLGLIALVFIPIFIFTVVTFLMWLYRTFTNLPAMRSDSNEFTPGWAVGWWFIPFANLVKPYQAVRTVWSESDPDVSVDDTSFLSSVQAGAPAFLMIWWGVWIVGNIVSNVSNRIDVFAKPGLQSLGATVGVIESIIWIAGSVLAIKVVTSITDRQEQRHTKVGDVGFNEPPPPPTFSSGYNQQDGNI